MGWVVFWLVIYFVFFRKTSFGCKRRHEHAHGAVRSRRKRSNRSASETYRMQAEAEDMNRRMRVMERMLDPRDARLRRDIQNL